MKRTLLTALGLLSAGGLVAAAGPRIRVGPNILVSRDGDVAHCETMIAANPRDAKNLLGGSITLTRPNGGNANKAYVSFDSGSTWRDVNFPEELEYGGADPQVGFGIGGTAYFVGLSNGMNFYRSEDGGKTWSKALNVGHVDHEMLVTDQTLGAYAGRVYLTGETGEKDSNEIEDLQMRRRVVLFRSSDDGRSFVGPIEVARGHGKGLAAENLLVLSDGTLFVPMIEYPNYAVDKSASTWKTVFSLSNDGGVTFSAPRPVADIRFREATALPKTRSVRTDQMGQPVFAVDAQGSRYRDRLYAAWPNFHDDRFQLLFSYSSDRGRTWSKPKPVDSGASADASQYQPMIFVNKDGVLGVFFYDTAGAPRHDHYDVYFTASVDGGVSFLPKVRVSSTTSDPLGAGNMRPGPIVSEDHGLVTASFISGFSTWPQGGHYIGLAADPDGVFHPFWSDARSGTFQLYTAPILVETDVASSSAASPAKPETERVPASLSSEMTLEFDPVRYDAEKQEVFLPARLKNTSKDPLYPPFHVEIKEMVHPYDIKAGLEPLGVPKILNASNAKSGVGAVFDYSNALHDFESLEPGAVTDAVIWRLKVSSPSNTNFYFGAQITGFVEQKREKAK